ncbi:YaiI/YqxD family protein [Metabacillus kandeliae]|uniref:YaiI/YqxD family protein n=1 Tax=Metabacillus kandeliae TaxID=2900151 RepID=UPI0038CC0FF3
MKIDEKKPKIYVDADACPVKAEIASAARKHGIETIFVASYNHASTETFNGKWVYVDTGKEAADLQIVNMARSGDIVVTQDIGLAGLLLKRDVIVLTPRGKQYTETNIGTALEFRYLSAMERRSGNYLKGPKKQTDEDKHAFSSQLEKILSNLAGING